VGVRLDKDIDGVVPWSDLLKTGGELPDADIDTDSDACIFYTSGTTGRPKGAQLTHRGCVSNIMSMGFWGATQVQLGLRNGTVTQEMLDAAPPSAGLITTPLFHVTANNCGAQGATVNGGKLVLMYRWDAGEALKIVEQEKISSLGGVPVMAREIISHPDFDKYDTSSLATLGGGGAQLQPDLVHKIDEAAENARPNTGFGMTETCGVITVISGDFFVDKPESCGPAMPAFDVKCVDDDGNTLPQGEVGELLVKGAHVIRGYLNREDATAETISDGWLRTGDVARIDEDDFIYIVDRKKDMLLRGGENIYCAEVESAVFEHPDVAECTVFGVPDDRLGEEVGVAVLRQPDSALSADDLRSHCTSLIAKHKIPRYVWFMKENLPRNANGKFLKRELRDTLDPADAE
ncbi:MAG: AMP-binding protein, partial [Pseudomonadota bacterium]